MRAGELRHKVDIKRKVLQTEKGITSATNIEIVASPWAEVKALTGKELVEAKEIVSEVNYRVRLRYREGITNDMWVEHEGKALEILAVFDPEGRRRELHLLCKERSSGSGQGC